MQTIGTVLLEVKLQATHYEEYYSRARRSAGDFIATARLCAGRRGEQPCTTSRTGGAVKDSFNADFYVTAATVIPVLFLALAVQGSIFDGVLRWLYRVTVRIPGILARRIDHPTLVRLFKIPKIIPTRTTHLSRRIRAAGALMKVLASTVVSLLTLSLIGSLIGEVLAILALYDRQSSPWRAYVVLISVIILAAMIALVPIGRLAATLIGLLSMTIRDGRDRKHAEEITLETNEKPYTVADLRLQFASSRTRESAARLAEYLTAAVPYEERRKGSPTDEDIQRALHDTWN
jgi:hypothetical protein